MAGFSATTSLFDDHKVSNFTFHRKLQKPVKAAKLYSPHSTYAKDMPDGLVSLGLDFVSVKQTIANRRSPAVNNYR
jgi:hypothetical protein